MEYTTKDIDNIGDSLRKGTSLKQETELKKFTTFTTNHSESVTFFLNILDTIGDNEENSRVVVSRLKRRKSIVDKLERESKMKLHRMQDISGVRIIVNSLDEVKEIRKCVIEKLQNQKAVEFFKNNEKNYIRNPKHDGYRGVHLIFLYKKLRTEIQIRTQMQHYFATAVEILNWKHNIYKDDEDSKALCECLKGISNVFYFSLEKNRYGKYFYKKLLTSKTAFDKVLKDLKKIQIIDIKLGEDSHDFLILSKSGKNLKVIDKSSNEKEAIEKYMELQQTPSGKENVVLLRNTSVKKAKENFPNYFDSAEKFTKLMKRVEIVLNKLSEEKNKSRSTRK